MKKLLYLLLSLVFVLSLSAFIACDNPTGKGDSGLKIRKIDGVYTVIDYVPEEGVTELTIDTIDGKEIGAIKKGAFSGNASLTKITVGSSVEEIGEGAFANMKSLEEITLPFVGFKKDAVNDERLFGHAFYTTEEYDEGKGYSVTQNYSESGTISYYLPSTLKTVNIVAIENYELPRYAFSGISRIETITLQGTITKISDNAFSDCTGLKKVVISDEVAVIGNNAFKNCLKLKGDLGTTDTAVVKFTASSKLTKLCNSAFENTKLVNVTLPNLVETIGEHSFSNSEVEEVILSAEIKTIGHYAFYNATKLESIKLSNVESIGIASFQGCESLKTIEFGGDTTAWGNVTKGASWNKDVVVTLVKCSNGDVAL